jgi:tripartite-type tricarboxylate transporter receptor subunit TctC
MAESGIPGYAAANWFGIVVPAKTPRPVVAKLNQDIARALAVPEVKERMLSYGMEPVTNSPEAFAVYVQSEISKWARVIKASGAKAN